MTNLDLPVNVPWKLIASSPDMMDTTFCNKLFPFAWRSSLAISVYEPKQDDQPEQFANERIAYLKITCSITGYQPSQQEVENGYTEYEPKIEEDKRDRLVSILAEYFACYGALLNIAVFPYGTRGQLESIKIDFGQQQPGSSLPNPYHSNQVVFENYAVKYVEPGSAKYELAPSIYISDYYPSDRDQRGEMICGGQIIIRLPPSPRVEAKVVLFTFSGDIGDTEIVMEAYNRSGVVISKGTGPATTKGQLYDLIVSGEDIDQVIIKFNMDPSGVLVKEASFLLLEFIYDAWQDRPVELKDYPHIIDFEPKVRDYYQTATTTGEILTASKSSLTVDKSQTNTESTQTGISGGISAGIGKAVGIQASASHSMGETTTDTTSTTTDSHREKRETSSVTTQLNQLYNMLTGYHVGTNRALFLMLPRINIIQPERRTFIQGLRYLEGIQDIFLVVTRPKYIEGLSVEVLLETSHLPEQDPSTTQPQAGGYIEEFEVEVKAPLGTVRIDKTYTIQKPGFVIDSTQGDPGHPGVHLKKEVKLGKFDNLAEPFDYQAVSLNTVLVKGLLSEEVFLPRPPDCPSCPVQYYGRFFVYIRSQDPTAPQSAKAETDLLITSRGLCSSFKMTEHGPASIVVTTPEAGKPISNWDSIVDETQIELELPETSDGFDERAQQATMKKTLRRIEQTMNTSWKLGVIPGLPRRKPIGTVGYLDSKYFLMKVDPLLPPLFKATRISDIPDLPEDIVQKLGRDLTIGEVLKMDLAKFASKGKLNIVDAMKIRHKILAGPNIK